jgi:hypothetical protein
LEHFFANRSSYPTVGAARLSAPLELAGSSSRRTV